MADIELKFNGGLNTVDPSTQIADHELVECHNFWYPNEILTKRPGFFRISGTTMTPFSPVILGYDPTSAQILVRSFGSNAIWRVSLITGVVTPLTNPSGASIRWMLYANGTTYLGGFGAGGIRTLSGITITDPPITNSPTGDHAVFHKQRIFASVSSAPGRIAFSGAGTGFGTWAIADTIDVGVDDADPIVGLISLGDLLLIFKTNSTWILYVQGFSAADWVVRKIGSIGAAPSAGSASTYYYNGEAYFISRTGLYKTNGSSFVNLSEKVWNPVENNFTLGVDPGQGMWRVTRFADHLILVGHFDAYVSAGLATGYAYAYNLRNGAWSSWDFLEGNPPIIDAFGLPTGSPPYESQLLITKGNHLYFTSDAAIDNYSYLLSTGINSFADGHQHNTLGTGSAYSSRFESKKFTSSVDDFLRLKFAGLEYIAHSSPSFQWRVDDALSSVQSPGFNATQVKGYKMSGGHRARGIALRASYAHTSPFEFYRANLHLGRKVPILASGTP